MATYEVLLRDGSTHEVDDVDAYEPEKTMTTFFRSNNSRRAIDCWSDRVASFRTDELLLIRLAASSLAGAEPVGSSTGRVHAVSLVSA